MLIQVLVREQIDGGQEALNALVAHGVPVAGAFWCRLPADYWKLIVASEFVSQFGPLAAYQKMRAILGTRTFPDVSASDVALYSPRDPEYLRLRNYAVGPGRFGVGPASGAPRNSNFEEAWVYI